MTDSKNVVLTEVQNTFLNAFEKLDKHMQGASNKAKAVALILADNILDTKVLKSGWAKEYDRCIQYGIDTIKASGYVIKDKNAMQYVKTSFSALMLARVNPEVVLDFRVNGKDTTMTAEELESKSSTVTKGAGKVTREALGIDTGKNKNNGSKRKPRATETTAPLFTPVKPANKYSAGLKDAFAQTTTRKEFIQALLAHRDALIEGARDWGWEITFQPVTALAEMIDPKKPKGKTPPKGKPENRPTIQ